MWSMSSLLDTTRSRWCMRYDSTRNSWLVNRTGALVQRDAGLPWIERHRPAVQHGVCVTARAPNQRAKPGEHFLDAERLGDVVVGAAVDALHLLVPARAGRQHEHRHGDAARAPLSEQGQTIDPRQPEVEDDRIVGLGAHEKIGALAVPRSVDGVAGVGTLAGQLIGQRRLVFDDQHTHRSLLNSRYSRIRR